MWKYIKEEYNWSKNNYKRYFIDIKGRDKSNFNNYFKQYIAAYKKDKDNNLDFKAYI